MQRAGTHGPGSSAGAPAPAPGRRQRRLVYRLARAAAGLGTVMMLLPWGAFVVEWLLDAPAEEPGLLRPADEALLVAVYAPLLGGPLLLGFYLPHVLTRPGLQQRAQVLWSLALWLLAPVVMPVYWVRHVLRESAPGGSR